MYVCPYVNVIFLHTQLRIFSD